MHASASCIMWVYCREVTCSDTLSLAAADTSDHVVAYLCACAHLHQHPACISTSDMHIGALC